MYYKEHILQKGDNVMVVYPGSIHNGYMGWIDKIDCPSQGKCVVKLENSSVLILDQIHLKNQAPRCILPTNIGSFNRQQSWVSDANLIFSTIHPRNVPISGK